MQTQKIYLTLEAYASGDLFKKKREGGHEPEQKAILSRAILFPSFITYENYAT